MYRYDTPPKKQVCIRFEPDVLKEIDAWVEQQPAEKHWPYRRPTRTDFVTDAVQQRLARMKPKKGAKGKKAK